MSRSIIFTILMFFSAAVSAKTSDRLTDYKDSLKVQLQFADSLAGAGNYFDAVTEYERLMCFDGSRMYGYQALLGEARAYYAAGRYAQSVSSAANAIRYSKSKEMEYAARETGIRSALAGANYAYAVNTIEIMSNDSGFTGKSRALAYWRGWAHLLQDEWSLAAESFSAADTAGLLKNFCIDVEKRKYPVSFIKVLSAILPGSGAIITGHYRNGLISFGWNALFGYLTISSFTEGRAVDGILTGELLFLRFYTGNLENTDAFLKEKNAAISNEALLYLQNEFQGSKP